MSKLKELWKKTEIKLGVIVEDEAEMNKELGMYLQAEEIIYFFYKYQNDVYGFTNKAIITKKPVSTEDQRESVTRFPFTQYFVTNTDIKKATKEIDIEITFTLNRYNKVNEGQLKPLKENFVLTIDKTLEDYAVIVYKLVALLEEKQQEQKVLEGGMLDATNKVLERNTHTINTLADELLVTKKWLLHNVYTTQFANIHTLFEDAMKAYIIHKNKESDGLLFANMMKHFNHGTSDKTADTADTIIDVEVEEIKK